MKGVYLVTDRTLCGARGVTEVVAQAARAGACCVQLREKTASTRRFIDAAEKIRTCLAPHRIPLIINDRVDVALAAGADGVHVGQRDMPPETARRLLGPDAIIGLSVETWEDVVAAQALDVNYLGISPVFATPTKTDTGEPWGLEGIQRIKRFSRYPLVGIGGLDLSVDNLTIEVNQSNDDSPVVNFTALPGGFMAVPTGVATPDVEIDFADELLRASGFVTLQISQFIYVSGGFAFEQGSTQTVTLVGGATNEVDMLRIGASHVHAFVGLGGPDEPGTSHADL